MSMNVDITLSGDALCVTNEALTAAEGSEVEEPTSSTEELIENVTIFSNSPPYLDPPPDPVIQVYVGQAFSKDFGTPIDPDGDEVEGILHVDSLGSLGFADGLTLVILEGYTTPADVGIYMIEIELEDNAAFSPMNKTYEVAINFIEAATLDSAVSVNSTITNGTQ